MFVWCFLQPNSPEAEFGPVVDGEEGFLPDLRARGEYNHVPLMAAVTTEDGAVGVPQRQ